VVQLRARDLCEPALRDAGLRGLGGELADIDVRATS
jgi:hypothetical protein